MSSQTLQPTFPWIADQGDGTYRNPILFADYSDPDVIRVGDDFYMTASSFNCTPGLPVLHSQDLVNWTLINYVTDRLPFPGYDEPAHGNGVWAPSLRYHAGKFWVFFGDPDIGILMSTADDPAGKWSPLHLVKPAKGWIDPCPFWDDDGQAYLVHAFAKSRAGIKSILHICRMRWDGAELLDDGQLVFDGTVAHPTIEGPKLYKRNGYCYIFAPAGGVKTGWQTVLRSQNIYGPYEDKIVLAQGNSNINGPHQGGWVELESGEGWFIHFQDQDAYGRIVHLQPVRWVDDWPIIGYDQNRDGVGEPVVTWKKPDVGKTYPIVLLPTSDEFDSEKFGLQWQWHANQQAEWMSLAANPGHLRLYSVRVSEDADLWKVPNLLLQKLPAPAFTVTTQLTFTPELRGERAGLAVMGQDYACVMLVKQGDGFRLAHYTKLETGSLEEVAGIDWPGKSACLRISVREGAICQFSYSQDGQTFKPMSQEFQARSGRWIGAKVGLFCVNPNREPSHGWADFDWFRFSP